MLDLEEKVTAHRQIKEKEMKYYALEFMSDTE